MLGRRADGYHEIRTVFQTITLHDTITFRLTESKSISLSCDVSDIPTGEVNLIIRAADALLRRFDVGMGASIHLEKRIPVSAGLGGGSSDAAITLLALARLWELDLTRTELEDLGAGLGADVPFFLTGGTAVGRGLGTTISPLSDIPVARLLVVKPEVEVSTADAYRALNLHALTKDECDTILSSSRLHPDFSDFLSGILKNDFESVVFGMHPQIMRARDELISQGARSALLAGSGASVFGVFDSVEAQERATAAMRQQNGWRVLKCATLSRDCYLKDLGECAAPLRDAFPRVEGFDIGA